MPIMFSVRGPLSFAPCPRIRTLGIYVPIMKPEELVLARFIHETGCELISSKEQFRDYTLMLGYTTMLWFDDVACCADCMSIISQFAEGKFDKWHGALLYVYMYYYMLENSMNYVPLVFQSSLRTDGFFKLAATNICRLDELLKIIEKHKHLLFAHPCK